VYSQIGRLSGFCATGAGNLFLLDHVIISYSLLDFLLYLHGLYRDFFQIKGG